MKKVLPFVISAVSLLAGCSADKSADVQTNATPTGGKAYDAPKGGVSANPSIPDAAKSAIPGAK